MQPVSDSVEIKIVPTHANLRRIHMIVILNSFDYLTIPFDYLILGQNIANSTCSWNVETIIVTLNKVLNITNNQMCMFNI